MDQTLSKLEEKILTEKKSFSFDLEVFKNEAVEYIKLLNELIDKLAGVKSVHVEAVNNLMAEKTEISMQITALRIEHSKLSTAHEQFLSSKEKEAQVKVDRLEELTEKEKNLNNLIDGLMIEYKTTDAKIVESRGTISSTERSLRDVKSNLEKLTASVSDKQKELETVNAQISEAKKDFSRLSSDLAILEARAKNK